MNWKILSLLSILPVFLFLNQFFSPQICSAEDQALLYKGRVWQKIGSGKVLNWNDANQYCRDLLLNGYTDWRLPTQQEMGELEVCTDLPKIHSSPPQSPKKIVLGIRGKECNEDLDYAGGGRINPGFKLHMTKEFNIWRSRYWTQTTGFVHKSIRSKLDTKHDGYCYFPFLYDGSMSTCSPPTELHFVRCVHDQRE